MASHRPAEWEWGACGRVERFNSKKVERNERGALVFPNDIKGKNGAEAGIRTPDLLITNQLLYP
jgi:hypothetical protein